MVELNGKNFFGQKRPPEGSQKLRKASHFVNQPFGKFGYPIATKVASIRVKGAEEKITY